MIQRPPYDWLVGREGVAELTAKTRIEQVAEAKEEPCGVRPGDIVQISTNQYGRCAVLDLLGYQHKFSVTLIGIVAGLRGLRMQAVQLNGIAGSQR